jgi:putative membrane protein
LVIGLALFSALIAREGVREVGGAIGAAGPGLVVVALFHLVPMLADAVGWRVLLARQVRPGVGTMLVARWIGESVNGLLPVLQIGGNVAKARWLVRRGVPGADAGASVVVDVTLVVLSQMMFTIVGLGLVLSEVSRGRLAVTGAIGLAVMATLIAGFLVVQRIGGFGALSRLAGRIGRDQAVELGTAAAALDARIRELYRERRAVSAACGWHLVSWLIGTGEVWLALSFLGHPVSLWTALLLESLGQAVRAGAFVVPGALGVQEGGFVVFGGALGLTPETALALSLAKRVREVLLGIPGLVVWQLDAVARRLGTPEVARGR